MAEIPPTRRALAMASLAGFLSVCTIAAATRLIAPASLRGIPDRPVPDDVSVVVSILVNNLVIATIPMFGGLLAARHIRAGRPLAGMLLAAVAVIVVAKSVAVVGIVGGLDPGWLVRAFRWWSLEIAAISVSAYSGLWLVRHRHASDRILEQVIRRALLAALPALGLAAIVEVFTA